MKIEIGRKYIDINTNEIVEIMEFTTEKNYVKYGNDRYEEYNFIKNLKEFHYSDCAVHNEPMSPKGKCDCQ